MLSIAQGVWSSPWSKLDQLLPILRLISGVLGRKSVTYLDYLYCRAKEWFASGRYLIKFRSYGITNVQGRGKNGLTLWKYFWVILLNSSFALILLRIISTSSLFFKDDNLMSFLILGCFRGSFLKKFWPFWKWIGTQWRSWAELWWNCLAEVDNNTRSRWLSYQILWG